jgi:1-aminocyclopropane-1-carboxylate deaminase/D-cysteine desulfhydrase-like pyridoxal-dependent ACC family enzyme
MNPELTRKNEKMNLHDLKIERRTIESLTPYSGNARTHSEDQVEELAGSIRDFGFVNPVLIGDDGGVIAGHGRLMAARSLGMVEVPTIELKHLTDVQRRQLILADNRIAMNAGWDMGMLTVELGRLREDGVDLSMLGFSDDELLVLDDPVEPPEPAAPPVLLRDKFMIPPFTVLNAREGWWQERKQSWMALGIASEVGRGDNLLKFSDTMKLKHMGGTLMKSWTSHPAFYPAKSEKEAQLGEKLSTADFIANHWVPPEKGAYVSGTSIFDPVLCELSYRWFSPAGGLILDPFAGGSVRGIVAAKLGRGYVGHELRGEQVAANREQAEKICADDPYKPEWIEGDSRNIPETCANIDADFIYSCPPYADLEVYSDDPLDLSTLGYEEFRSAYFDIIKKSCDRLKNDRFACFIVGEVRDKKGNYYDFVGDTVQAFREAGLHYYNEAILITAIGSLAMRAGKQFSTSRKLGKSHQNILVFIKGDPRKAVEACGTVDVSECFEGIEEELEPTVEDAVTEGLTPIQERGNYWFKRDDLAEYAGIRGGKARTCWHLAQGATGLVTAGSRASPQVNIVAHVAKALGIPARAHTPNGDLSSEVEEAQAAGAEIIQHKAGYNNVIIARAREDAAERGWREIPFGMECEEAVKQTSGQVQDIPAGVKRIVMPVGSGMSLAGVLTGLKNAGLNIPVLGVVVGADPIKRLNKYAPKGWQAMVTLVPSGVDYHDEATTKVIEGIRLDPIYEAKCIPFMQPDDLLWIVGIRGSHAS